MEEAALERILLVDDEPLVLEGLARQLGWEFEVSTAQSGARALELVQSEGPFAVVISDMRMPNMDGAEFLERARALDPDMVRVLLTGQSDLLQAIRAVNHGQLFRFLSKPCPPDVLVPTIQDAVRQHRLLTAERELLEKTLRGSVQTLLDTLALAQPDTFGRARRVEQYVVEVLDTIGEKEQWSIQLAALLCHLPLITLPPETLRRYFDGKRMSAAEQSMIDGLPEVGDQLLANIPRLELVRELLRTRDRPPASAPLGARVLRLVYDYHLLEARGLPAAAAIAVLERQASSYDPKLLALLPKLSFALVTVVNVRTVTLPELRVGMLLAEDVKAASGMTIVAKGTEVTGSLIQRLKNFSHGVGLDGDICVVTHELVPANGKRLASAS